MDDQSNALSLLASDWEVVKEYIRSHVVRMAPGPVIFGRKICLKSLTSVDLGDATVDDG